MSMSTYITENLICLGLSELHFRLKRFIVLIQRKKVISMNYGSSTSSWKPWRWVRFDLIFTMRDIYISSNMNPLTKFTSSSRSIGFTWQAPPPLSPPPIFNKEGPVKMKKKTAKGRTQKILVCKGESWGALSCLAGGQVVWGLFLVVAVHPLPAMV